MRNYLLEVALTLVEMECNYIKIWGKLLESFGNAGLMLQNKLSSLDEISGLVVIAGLINSKDLSSLASEHNIEGQLYEGGGLEKIMCLMGDFKDRKYRSGNLYSQGTKRQQQQHRRVIIICCKIYDKL